MRVQHHAVARGKLHPVPLAAPVGEPNLPQLFVGQFHVGVRLKLTLRVANVLQRGRRVGKLPQKPVQNISLGVVAASHDRLVLLGYPLPDSLLVLGLDGPFVGMLPAPLLLIDVLAIVVGFHEIDRVLDLDGDGLGVDPSRLGDRQGRVADSRNVIRLGIDRVGIGRSRERRRRGPGCQQQQRPAS